MIRIDHVTFSYGEENENAGGVHDINLTVEDGQCVVLCGESGCGKTTITRLINGLIPHYYEGKMNGEVWVNGAKVSEQPLYDTAKTVGSVFQNPRSQFFNVDTTSEITFGCENLGQPEQSIRERLDKTIRDFRLEKLMGRNIFHLSGGEKQKIACAGVSIMEPDVLVMDEPSSNLDASSILDLRAILAFWKSQGKTIIVSEHRLYYLRGLADRFIYITGGKVEKDYSVAEFESLTEQQRAKLGLRTFILEDLLPPKALPQAGQHRLLTWSEKYQITDAQIDTEQNAASNAECIEAIFNRYVRSTEQTIFMSRCFSAEYNETENAIRRAINEINNEKKTGIMLIRVDEHHEGTTGQISDRIFRDIESAGLVIADLSSGKLNVPHEIGYAMGLKKDLILVHNGTSEEAEKHIPSNIRMFEQIRFNGDYQTLQNEIKRRLIDYYKL